METDSVGDPPLHSDCFEARPAAVYFLDSSRPQVKRMEPNPLHPLPAALPPAQVAPKSPPRPWWRPTFLEAILGEVVGWALWEAMRALLKGLVALAIALLS